MARPSLGAPGRTLRASQCGPEEDRARTRTFGRDTRHRRLCPLRRSGYAGFRHHRHARAQKPRLLIAFGDIVPGLLAEVSPDLAAWKRGKIPNRKRVTATFPATSKYDEHKCLVLWLYHPSMRNSNVKHNRYNGLTGAEAEAALFCDALAESGIRCHR